MNEVVSPQVTEAQKQQFITYAKWGLMLAACAVALPVVVFGALGMVGILIAGGIGLVGINAAPVVAMKLANMKYRALDAEQLSHLKKVLATTQSIASAKANRYNTNSYSYEDLWKAVFTKILKEMIAEYDSH